MNIIEALYRDAVRITPREYGRERLLRRMQKYEDEVAAQLKLLPGSEAAGEAVSHMKSVQTEVSEDVELGRFIEGFQVGVRFVVDALVNPLYTIAE